MSNNDQPLPRLAYTPNEAAKALGVSRQHIYNMMNRGQLKSFKFGDARRIPAAEFDRLLATAEVSH